MMQLRRFLPEIAIYLLYLLVAIVVTWPLASDLSGQLAGFAYGDSTEMARHIWWYNHALRTGQPIFWQPALGYPDGMAGVLLWAHPQQFFPAWMLAFVMPVVAAANISILLYMALNGWAMFVLARHLLHGRAGPALLAGLVFMAAPTFQGHLGGGHAGLMVMWPVPLVVLALLRLEQADTQHMQTQRAVSLRNRWFWLAVLFFVLSPGGHILQLIYVLLPVTAVFMLRQLWRRDWRGLLRTLIVSALGSVILLIFVLPIAGETFDTPAYTAEGGFVRYSADLLSVVTPSFFNPLYEGLSYPRQVLGVNLEEGSSYLGIVAGLLALVGIIAAWRRGAGWWLALAFVALVLSLGPLLKVFDSPVRVSPDGYESYITLPWAILQNLPFFNLARTPGRFNFTLALAVAVLAGYGAMWLWDRLSHRRTLRGAVMLALAVAVLVDSRWYWPFPTTAAEIPAAIHALSQRDDLRAALDLPWNNTVAAKRGLYLQTAHQLPLVAGHVTRSTPVSPSKLTLLEHTLNPALLNQAGADVVIIHKEYAPETLLERARGQLGQPIHDDSQLAVFEMPDTDAAPDFTALATPDTWLERSLDSYVYAPESGWVDFTGRLIAGGERTVQLYIDGQPLHRWEMADEQAFTVPLPLQAQQYHIVTLALDPPCPASHNPALMCEGVTLDDLAFGSFIAEAGTGADFERGVRLLRGAAGEVNQGVLPVRLLWAFDEARDENDIRFVHVLDASDEIIVQDDRTLGDHAAGSQWAEGVSLALPEDLPAGEYRVYAGWYTYPDFTRFGVLSSVEGAENGLVLLGTINHAD